MVRASPAMSALFIAGAIVVVAWVVSGLLRFALSRSREYLADAGAVELTKDPDAMISALLKISGRAEIPGAPSGIPSRPSFIPQATMLDRRLSPWGRRS